MRYTGNANKVLWYIALPILIGSYLIFTLWENITYKDVQTYHKKHKIIIHNHSKIDGLILGGSNALYSLSAQQLNKESNIDWLNLSHLHEAYPMNYMELIKKTIPKYKRKSIQFIVFSSTTPYYFKHRMNDKTEAKNSLLYKRWASHIKKFFLKIREVLKTRKLLPKKRLSSHIKRLFLKKKKGNKPTKWPPAMHTNGDLDFTNSTYLCRNKKASMVHVDEDKISNDISNSREAPLPPAKPHV